MKDEGNAACRDDGDGSEISESSEERMCALMDRVHRRAEVFFFGIVDRI